MQILETRGAVVVVGGVGSSIYDVPGLSGTSGVIIDAIRTKDRDVVAPASTLEGEHIIYVFGEGLGDVSISGTLLMGSPVATPAQSARHEAFMALTDWFDKNRVSKLKDKLDVSIAGYMAFHCYVLSLAILEPDAEHQMLRFEITGLRGSKKAGEAGGG